MPPIPPEAQNGLSTATSQTNRPDRPQITLADMSPSGPSPSQVMNRPRSPGVLRVPLDTPMFYTQIEMAKYSRSSWREVGKLNNERAVIFPFPQTMVDNQNVAYEITPLGFAGGIGIGAVDSLLNAENTRRQAQEDARAVLGNAADAGARVLAGLGGPLTNAVLAQVGVAINDFMTVMLRGPQYAKRDFVWKFSPRSAQESTELRNAIRVLQNAKAPSLAGFASAFFGWPRIFSVKFKYDADGVNMSDWTFAMKPSVLLDASFNYTPAGTWAGYASTKAPESVELRLSFLELELWLNSGRDAQDAFGPNLSDSRPAGGN